MNFLSLFAGIGGFDRGLELAGYECVGQIELDLFCRRILARHWPHVARWSDVREWKSDGNESADLVCGGFPCQDLSVAGKRAGLSGERSGLFWHIVRIAKDIKPTWGLFENVPGLLSSNGGRDMWTVLAGLRECWPIVGYRVLDSQYFGVPQRRRRMFFVCGPTERSIREILFESASGGGHLTARGEAGERVAGVLGSGSSSTRLNFDGDYIVSDPLTGKPYADNEAQHRKLVVNALIGEGFDASEDGTGRGTSLVFQPKASASQSMNPSELAPAMGATKELGVMVANSLNANSGRRQIEETYIPANGVRRLTPVECSRLQGFPDDWCCLCGANENLDACTCPDSPRYRALGNAVTVNVIEWIGRRLRNLG